MLHVLKLSHHAHTGKLRPHEHTSYLPLGILLLFVGFALAAYTASAATPYDGPEASSVGLTGIMPGKPPTTAATIKTPTNGQHFAETPIKISGTCPKDTLVEIFKNTIFAGSAICSSNGLYELNIDLLVGQNSLIARVYDSLNQAGPDSTAITVFYDALPTQGAGVTSLDFGGAQLILNTDAVFRGVFPKQELSMPIDILGGTPPYAVNVQWGDTNNKVISRNNNISFQATHTYAKAGVYQVSLQASDAEGRVAFLTVASIVNGQPEVAAATTTAATTNQLLTLWPLYTAAVAVLISFWLGERREKNVLKSHGLLVNPQV